MADPHAIVTYSKKGAKLADVVEDAGAGDAHRRRRLLVLDAVERLTAQVEHSMQLLMG